MLALGVVEHLKLKEEKDFIKYIEGMVIKSAHKTPNVDKGICDVINKELSKYLAMPIFNGLTQRKSIAKRLRCSPLYIPRYMTDIKANGSFNSNDDMFAIVELVARQSSDCINVLTSVAPFRKASTSKIINNHKSRRFNGDPVVMIIGNALLSLNNKSAAEDRDKLYNAIEDLNDLLIDLHPVVLNVRKNITRLTELTHVATELAKQEIADTARVKSAKDQIKLKTNSIDRINNINIKSTMHPSINPKIHNALIVRLEAKAEYERLQTTYENNLVATQNKLAETKESIEILRSTIRSDKKDIYDGVRELLELLKLHTGLAVRDRFAYLLTNQNSW